MTKVILLGDSIRQIGYGTKVPSLLGEDYTVWQPGDNCRFAQYTLRGMWDWKAHMEGADIVHWNNGLWDMCDLFDGKPFTPKQVYADTILRIADILQKRAKRVIFATTTPVRAENPHDRNEWICEYNEFIVPLLSEKGVLINDLHAIVSADVNRFIREDDKLHLSPDGIDVCAAAVVAKIKEAEASI